MEALSKYLIKRDMQIQIPENTEVKRIQNAVENILHLILNSVQEKDPRLTGRVLKVGSYYSELKIGLPDEFDFVFELNSLEEGKDFEVMPSGFKGTKNLWRTPEGDPLKKKIFLDEPAETFLNVDKLEEDDSVRWLRKVSNDEYVLDQIGVKNTLYFAIMEAIKSLEPSQFHRNLQLDLSEEETFIHGPAITMFFIWKGRKYRNLNLSVDVTIALKATKNWQEHFDVFQANNNKESSFLGNIIAKEIGKNGYHLVPHVSDRGHIQWKISTSFLETRICSRFPKNSKFKQLIRVLKSLKDKHLRLLPNVDLLKDDLLASQLRLYQFYFEDDFNDHHHLVSSYVIKTAVFALCKFATFSEWKNASIGTLYLLAISSLYNCLSTGVLKNVFISKQKLKLPQFGDVLPGFHRIFQEMDEILSIENQKLSHSIENNCWEILEDPFKKSEVIFRLFKEKVEENFNLLWQQ